MSCSSRLALALIENEPHRIRGDGQQAVRAKKRLAQRFPLGLGQSLCDGAWRLGRVFFPTRFELGEEGRVPIDDLAHVRERLAQHGLGDERVDRGGFRLPGGEDVTLKVRRPGGELVARQRGEGIPGTEHRVVRLARCLQVALPDGDHAPEPPRVEAGGERAFLDPAGSRLEIEVVGGLEVV